MASLSSSLSNFLSFLPVKPPPHQPQPPRVFLHRCGGGVTDGFVPLSTDREQERELAAVINPAAANSNTLYFSGYNVQVLVEENEPEERLLNRFRREVMRAGIIQECRRRRFFENKQDEKKRRTREAAKRNRKRRPQFRGAPNGKPEETTAKKSDLDDDNWDLPEDDVTN
ncbi:hypothetical protein MLD38_000115 [Melastoma candidum]|uniref:Uncharacterized protein n=1 Tax=Melastoma candidum TaxID=119954 RepID=A0ACB9S8T2_9MYRT|nr:hypothetical protein MLD38_000115 [Melastoma candidum]